MVERTTSYNSARSPNGGMQVIALGRTPYLKADRRYGPGSQLLLYHLQVLRSAILGDRPRVAAVLYCLLVECRG